MTVADLGFQEFERQLRSEGLPLRLGPFDFRIRVDDRAVVAVAYPLYASYSTAPSDGVFDAHVHLAKPHWIRRWIRPQGRFLVDGRCPLVPHAARHGFPSLEWGLNWCIATRAHHFLMLHAAVIERENFAMLLPAAPGYGKSTLCTALIHSGWRLLSDEFGLVDPEDHSLVPIPRLIPLKNESIAVVREFAPAAFIGPLFEGTHKGTVAHVLPPAESIWRSNEKARARWLVFPRWISSSPLRLDPMPRSQAFLMVAANAFNYEILGEMGFSLVAAMIDECECFTLTYSDLKEAVTALKDLTSAANG